MEAECDLSTAVQRSDPPPPPADHAVGRPGCEKAALCRAPEAAPRDSTVVSHERDLFRAGHATDVERSFFTSFAAEGERKREGKRGRGAFFFLFFPVGHLHLLICVFDQEEEKLFYPPHHHHHQQLLPLPSPPPTAAKCLKYLTGFLHYFWVCAQFVEELM